MKYILIIIIGMLAVHRSFAEEVSIDASTASLTELQVYQEEVYPFFRTHCSECHDERAIWPVGPSHSHSDPVLAFGEFNKRFDRENFRRSKIWRVGSNAHYCDEHYTNCDRVADITMGLEEILDSYAQKIESIEVNQRNGSDRVLVATKRFDPSNPFVLIPAGVNSMGEDIEFTMSFDRIGESNFYALKYLQFWTLRGFYKISGVQILINGKAPNKKTGYENLNRYLVFSDPEQSKESAVTRGADEQIAISTRLAPQQPILEIREGAEISIELTSFEELETLPQSTFCQSSDRVLDLSERLFEWSSYHEFRYRQDLSALTKCRILEADINYDSPRRSNLFISLEGLIVEGRMLEEPPEYFFEFLHQALEFRRSEVQMDHQ